MFTFSAFASVAEDDRHRRDTVGACCTLVCTPGACYQLWRLSYVSAHGGGHDRLHHWHIYAGTGLTPGGQSARSCRHRTGRSAGARRRRSCSNTVRPVATRYSTVRPVATRYSRRSAGMPTAAPACGERRAQRRRVPVGLRACAALATLRARLAVGASETCTCRGEYSQRPREPCMSSAERLASDLCMSGERAANSGARMCLPALSP